VLANIKTVFMLQKQLCAQTSCHVGMLCSYFLLLIEEKNRTYEWKVDMNMKL